MDHAKDYDLMGDDQFGSGKVWWHKKAPAMLGRPGGSGRRHEANPGRRYSLSDESAEERGTQTVPGK